jgi:hypothetical protein
VLANHPSWKTMSASCVGTCKKCGVQQLWLSDTLALQLDDGKLICLPHPGESWQCEKHGLTIAMASQRGRLFRETFYVCRHCGKRGSILAKLAAHRDHHRQFAWSVPSAMRLGWGSALVVIPGLLWLQLPLHASVFGIALLLSSVLAWRENRKIDQSLAASGLPRADAPGATAVAAPTESCLQDTVVGQVSLDANGHTHAFGACCDRPDWVEATSVQDADAIPCCACQQAVMTVSDRALH